MLLMPLVGCFLGFLGSVSGVGFWGRFLEDVGLAALGASVRRQHFGRCNVGPVQSPENGHINPCTGYDGFLVVFWYPGWGVTNENPTVRTGRLPVHTTHIPATLPTKPHTDSPDLEPESLVKKPVARSLTTVTRALRNGCR